MQRSRANDRRKETRAKGSGTDIGPTATTMGHHGRSVPELRPWEPSNGI